MSLYIAGGYEEHGRNCFLIENPDYNVMIDCGIMNGSNEPYPRLSKIQIEKTKYLFITHSHIDHTGALNFLYQNGFSGLVILSRHTFFQINCKPIKFLFIEEIPSFMEMYKLEKNLVFMWGKSGHCIGSVWYYISFLGQKYMFTGDYCEHSLSYKCDKIRGLSADFALIDCAYGSNNFEAEFYLNAFEEKLSEICFSYHKILLPVPKYGRGMDIAAILQKVTADKLNIFADSFVLEPIMNMKKYSEWILPGIQFPIINDFNTHTVENGISLIADPQLESPENRRMAEEIISDGGIVIFTGNVDENSFSKKLIESNQAAFIRFPVHQNLYEARNILSHNLFCKIFLVHTSEKIVED